MSFTTNVISLQTLQKELSLRNIGNQQLESPSMSEYNYSKQLLQSKKPKKGKLIYQNEP